MTRARTTLWKLGAPVRGILVGIIRVYQVTLSGVFGGRCKYYPTCSRYAVEAIRTHGAAKGSALALWRLLRCNPLSRGGVDHVPHREAPDPTYDPVIRPGNDEHRRNGSRTTDRVEA